MSHYTPDDITAAVQAVREHGEWSKRWAPDTPRCIAFDVLEKVAPVIAARALRDFADNHVGVQTPARMAEDLHARADEIEAGE